MELLLRRPEVGIDGEELDLVRWVEDDAFPGRRFSGVSVKKSNKRTEFLCSRRAMRNPPPPGDENTASATKVANVAASAASKALPPSSRISAAARAVSSCPAATTPLVLLIEFA